MVGYFFALRKSLRGMKKNFRMPQESFEKLFTDSRPYIQNSKGFRDPITVEKQWPQHYVILQMKVRWKK